jgi:hypothetical protein
VDLLRTGINTLAGGARRGNPGLAALGATLLVVGLMRRRRRPGRRRLYTRVQRPGEALRIRLLAPGEEPEASR